MDASQQNFTETERKYEAPADFALPDLSGLPSGAVLASPQVHQLRAVYYDTEDLRLLAARITLRRRTGGTDAGWHLKLPAGQDTRREIHAPLDDAGAQGAGREDAIEVPAELAARVSDWTGGQPLRPVARLDTTRTVRKLTGQDGQVLAEVADDLVTGWLPGQPAWRVAARWRELEVELGTGATGLLDAVALRLTQSGAYPSAAASKLGRLLGQG